MASIHVVYDPNDRITGLKPEHLNHIEASAVVLRVHGELTPASIGQISGELAAMLLKEVAGK